MPAVDIQKPNTTTAGTAIHSRSVAVAAIDVRPARQRLPGGQARMARDRLVEHDPLEHPDQRELQVPPPDHLRRRRVAHRAHEGEAGKHALLSALRAADGQGHIVDLETRSRDRRPLRRELEETSAI